MLKCYLIKVFEISCSKNSAVSTATRLIKDKVCKNYSRTENMCGFFFFVYDVFGLSTSTEICPNQYFLRVTHLQHVLFKADFLALCLFYFFRKF
jgi:hypothetical protein